MRRFTNFAAAIVLVCSMIGGGAAADQNDSRLGGLFDALRSASDPYQAFVIEQQIVLIWVESSDDKVNALMSEGIVAINSGNFKTALEKFDHMVEIAPDFAEGWNKRATVHYLMGNFRASIADIDRTLLLEPRHFLALSGLGLVEIQLDNTSNAIDAFQRALVIHPLMTGPRANIDYLRKEQEKNAI